MDSTVTCHGCGKQILREHSHPFRRPLLLTQAIALRLLAFQYVYGQDVYFCRDCFHARQRRLKLLLLTVGAIAIILILATGLRFIIS